MQIFASLLRSCVLLALSTGSLGQSVPASALEELRVEFHEMNEVLRNENALKFEEVKNENIAFRLELEEKLQNKNEALRHELENKTEMFRVELAEVKNKLEDVRAVLQTQPRRTVENNYLSCMREDEDSGDIYFEGCNVHVRSGNGHTRATLNGKGNLIIGYNELPDSLMEVPESPEGLEETEAKKFEAVELDVSNNRGGSHNLVIGDQHEYTSFGGIVTGQWNGIYDKYSAVVGGYFNKATGIYATVTGGAVNTASGWTPSISGGYGNMASGEYSSISGGRENKASGDLSSVLGGRVNDAQGEATVVMGGIKNKAIGARASVVGGKQNIARKKLSVVTGA